MINIKERNSLNVTLDELKKNNTDSLVQYNKFKEALKLYEQNKYNLAKKSEDGVIFHAWNWLFNDVKNNIVDIAKAGFSSIQVSPVQPTKNNNLTYTGDWWQFYQPVDFTVGNSLGSEEDFRAMCEEANKYGIKIIVDVVTNHLANNTGRGNHAKWDRCDKIPSYLRDNDNFWHAESNGAFNNNDFDRTSMTQGAIGMPGLNTANKDLQGIIINFLNRLQELGASGFRFDAAKHIELPEDTVSSDYWPSVTAGIKNKDKDAFIYGEILNECGTDIKNYSKYLKVTDNVYGWNVIDAVINCNAGLAQFYCKNDVAKNFITWVESHDTYAGDYGRKSDRISDEDILLGWCIVASRADSVPLFFCRPSNGLHGRLGETSDLSWQDKKVSEINRFHNKFSGSNEYIRILNNNSVFLIERGTTGVSIINLSRNYTVIDTETNLKDGEYTDRLSGRKITVSNGRLHAELDSRSVAVAYEEVVNKVNIQRKNNFLNKEVKEGYIYATKPSNWGKKIYAYIYINDQYVTPWPGVEMKYNNNDNKFYCEIPEAFRTSNTQVIFSDGYNQLPMAFTPGAYYKEHTAMLFENNTIKNIKPSITTSDLLLNDYFELTNNNSYSL